MSDTQCEILFDMNVEKLKEKINNFLRGKYVVSVSITSNAINKKKTNNEFLIAAIIYK